MTKKNNPPANPVEALDPPVTNVTAVHFAPVDAPEPANPVEAPDPPAPYTPTTTGTDLAAGGTEVPPESKGDEPTLRDGQPKQPPAPPAQTSSVLDLSTFPYPFNVGEWHVLANDVDPGLRPVVERAYTSRLDTPSVDVFTPHEHPQVTGVVYSIKRATRIVILITGESLKTLNSDVDRSRDVKDAKERALADQQRAGAALTEGAARAGQQN